jgi:dihydrofolate synthase/folylpolyglutamate synthase
LATCELISERKAVFELAKIKNGLRTNQWPGRLETVSTDPLIILDGAHNLAAARNLGRFLTSNLAGHQLTLVIGILADKPYRAMLKSLLPLARRVILTRAHINRALDPQKLLDVAGDFNLESKIIPDVAGAVKHAIETNSCDGVICIAGSLYVVGEAKEALERGLLNGRNASK